MTITEYSSHARVTVAISLSFRCWMQISSIEAPTPAPVGTILGVCDRSCCVIRAELMGVLPDLVTNVFRASVDRASAHGRRRDARISPGGHSRTRRSFLLRRLLVVVQLPFSARVELDRE